MNISSDTKEIIENAYRLFGKRKYGARPVWVFLRDLLGVGSQSARFYCNEFEWQADSPCKTELK